MKTSDAFLHWWWLGFFVGFGILILLRSRSFGGFGCEIDAACDSQQRISAAFERRRTAEPLSRWLVAPWGIASIAIGVVAAVTHVLPVLLYALMCLCGAITFGVAYLHLRNLSEKRVAVLAARSPFSAIPPLWFAAAMLSALSILPFATQRDDAVPTLVVFFSTLATVAISWRLTLLPAVLSGVDVPAEQAVDDRIRARRSSSVLFLALVQPLAFSFQSSELSAPVQVASLTICALSTIALAVWMRNRPLVHLSTPQLA